MPARLATKNPTTLIPAAPAMRQITLLGATKTSGYAARPNQRSTWRIVDPQVRVRRSIQVTAASPYQ